MIVKYSTDLTIDYLKRLDTNSIDYSARYVYFSSSLDAIIICGHTSYLLCSSINKAGDTINWNHSFTGSESRRERGHFIADESNIYKLQSEVDHRPCLYMKSLNALTMKKVYLSIANEGSPGNLGLNSEPENSSISLGSGDEVIVLDLLSQYDSSATAG